MTGISASSGFCAIARAISFNPKVVILDEPTANLSHTATQTLLQTMTELKAQGIQVIGKEILPLQGELAPPVLKPAVAYQRVAAKNGVPRNNH